MHEEDRKFDAQFKTKTCGGGDRVFALRGGLCPEHEGDKRPPKEETRVVVQPKGERPPPQNNNNQGDKKGDKRGKP